jgi:hypothetical protein
MKSGTTYLQSCLMENRDLLAEDDILYVESPARAVHDVLGHRVRHVGELAGGWAELVATVRAWPGSVVVISAELLAPASEDQIAEIVQTLEPADVRVVLTARDIARTLPSAWQQTTKNRQVAQWGEYVRTVTLDRDDHDRLSDQFWRHHDVPAIVRRWSNEVGPDRFTVVTVPPEGAPPELLWERFCSAVGLDRSRVPARRSDLANTSLGYAEAEVVRRINELIPRWIDQPTYRRLVNNFVVHQILRRRTVQSPQPRLPDEIHHWATGFGAKVVTELQELGVRVVGDLDDLVPSPPRPEPADDVGRTAPADVDLPEEAAISATALEAAAALILKLAGPPPGASNEETESAPPVAWPQMSARERRQARRERRLERVSDDG